MTAPSTAGIPDNYVLETYGSIAVSPDWTEYGIRYMEPKGGGPRRVVRDDAVFKLIGRRPEGTTQGRRLSVFELVDALAWMAKLALLDCHNNDWIDQLGEYRFEALSPERVEIVTVWSPADCVTLVDVGLSPFDAFQALSRHLFATLALRKERVGALEFYIEKDETEEGGR